MDPKEQNIEKTSPMIFPTYLMKQQTKAQNQEVTEAKGKLDHLISDLNDKLVNHFKTKQQALLNEYKKELIQQQKILNDLKNNTNEEQIRNKMIERKNQLEKERNHLLQTNMFFSQKCEQYKQTYTKLVHESKDLQRQLLFLDQQTQIATSKRLSLVDEVQENKESKIYETAEKKKGNEESIQKTQQLSTLQKTKKSSSLKKIGNSLNTKKLKNREQTLGSLRNTKKIDPKILEKTALEKLFEESVEEIRQRRKMKRTMPNLKGEEFTEFEKKAIMQIFLSHDDVKKRLYEIIFSDGDKSNKDRQLPNEKVKISFEELGI